MTLNLAGSLRLVRPEKVFFPISMKFGMYIEVDEWCTTVCRRTRFKVEVTGLLNFQKLHFSNSMSSAVYNGSWQMTTNTYTTAQYLNFIRLDFCYLSYFLCHVTLNLEAVPVVSPSRSQFFPFQWYSVCRQVDDWCTMVCHMCLKATRGVDRQSRVGLFFYIIFM